jgi:endonuclease/exonuclease/phosphatase family metal-dependent hydrolase
MVKIASANTWRKLDYPAVVKCARTAARHADIIGFQEINKDDDKDGIIAGLGDKFSVENISIGDPIAFNTEKYRCADRMELPGGFQHRGIIQLSPELDVPHDPARYASYLILKELYRPTLPPVAVFNGHFPNRKPWLTDPVRIEANRQKWVESFMEFQWRVNTFLKHGLTCVWMGDFNELVENMPQFNPIQQVVSEHRLDHMYVAKGRSDKAANFTINGEYEVNTPSDHHMIVGKLTFTLP